MGGGPEEESQVLPSLQQHGNGLYISGKESHTVPLYNPEGDRLPSSGVSGDRGRPPDRGKPTVLTRPCFYLTSFIKALPVVFISLVVGWSYYAYVVAVILTAMASSPIEQAIGAVIFHCLAVMFIWSYFMVVFTPPGVVPDSWRLSKTQVNLLAGAQSEEEWKNILTSLAITLDCQVKQRSVQNAVRYCEKCLCIKTDRSHHCSVCETCTLKMDHHCPWVNNCVGFHNYKFFLLFLGYAVSYCLWIAATTARHFINIWLYREDEEETVAGSAKYHILFVFFVSILFSISLSSLFWYHIWLVLHNRSTLEQFRAPMFENNQSDPNGWSLGRLNNVREVFGSCVWLWPVPVSTLLGDGISFPTRIQLADCTTYHSIGPSLLSRCETPNRTLINPTLGKDGLVSSCQTTVIGVGSLSPDCRLTITPDSGVGETEVRLDSNGHAQILMVGDPESLSNGMR